MLHLVDEEEVIGQTYAHHCEPQFLAGDWTQQEDKALYEMTAPWGYSREASSVAIGRNSCRTGRREWKTNIDMPSLIHLLFHSNWHQSHMIWTSTNQNALLWHNAMETASIFVTSRQLITQKYHLQPKPDTITLDRVILAAYILR